MIVRRFCGIVAVSLLLVCGCRQAFAQLPIPRISTVHTVRCVRETAPSPTPLSDRRELGAFLDGVISAQMRDYHIAGAVVSVVKDGKLFYSKGYGWASVKDRSPVVPDRTLFRVGSVSKLFVWTSIMQLVEQGKLDLDDDVNRYLKTFRIPDAYGKPITIRNLMSHTPGFEDWPLSIFVRRPSQLEPLNTYLAENMPERVRPPGTYEAYSNYGAALAGLIVQNVSGKPFEDYVEDNILRPLKMTRSTFRQPVPPALRRGVSVGYRFRDGAFAPQAFELLTIPPAAGMSATAADMAKFMIAHLQNGRFGDTRILSEQTASLMHKQLFAQDPRVSGWAHGFTEMTLNGRRVISHGGDTVWFHTALVLLPKSNAGLFVSCNSEDAADAPDELVQAFADHYYPSQEPIPPRPSAAFAAHAGAYTGSYGITRRTYSKYAKVAFMLYQVTAFTGPRGELFLTSPESVSRWVRISRLLFHSTEERPSLNNVIVFQKGRGRMDHIFLQNNPTFVLERIPWYESTRFNIALLGVCALLFLSAVMVWPINYVIRRKYGRSSHDKAFHARTARWLLTTVSVLFVVFWALVVIALIDPVQFMYGPTTTAVAALAVGLAAAVLTIGVIIFSGVVWRNGLWSFAGRTHYTLVALAAVAFVWWLSNWNLLGFRY